LLGAVAQLERALIAERNKAGLLAARKRGRIGGNPVLDHQEQMADRAGKPVDADHDQRVAGDDVTQQARQAGQGWQVEIAWPRGGCIAIKGIFIAV
jgi:hypothetical protein